MSTNQPRTASRCTFCRDCDIKLYIFLKILFFFPPSKSEQSITSRSIFCIGVAYPTLCSAYLTVAPRQVSTVYTHCGDAFVTVCPPNVVNTYESRRHIHVLFPAFLNPVGNLPHEHFSLVVLHSGFLIKYISRILFIQFTMPRKNVAFDFVPLFCFSPDLLYRRRSHIVRRFAYCTRRGVLHVPKCCCTYIYLSGNRTVTTTFFPYCVHSATG